MKVKIECGSKLGKKKLQLLPGKVYRLGRQLVNLGELKTDHVGTTIQGYGRKLLQQLLLQTAYICPFVTCV